MDCVLPEVDRRGADEMYLAYGRAVDEDDDDGYEERATLPSNPHGLVFFHSLRVGQRHPVPRLRSGNVLSDKSFRYFFGVDIDEIDDSYFRTAARVERPGPILRSNNRTQRTRRYQGDATPRKLFHLGARGFKLQAVVVDDGSDLEHDGNDTDGVSGDDLKDIDMELTKLWLQFIPDITQKVSNRRGGDGYCNLSAEERRLATEGIYKNLHLSDFFNDCQWKVARGSEWENVFDNLFPFEDRLGKTQNYKSTLYYRRWKVIRDRADESTLEAIRRALKSRFDTLLWFPCAHGERIWITTSNATGYSKFINHGQPAPRVICKNEPSWA